MQVDEAVGQRREEVGPKDLAVGHDDAEGRPARADVGERVTRSIRSHHRQSQLDRRALHGAGRRAFAAAPAPIGPRDDECDLVPGPDERSQRWHRVGRTPEEDDPHPAGCSDAETVGPLRARAGGS